jgi:hypothetical protein
MAKLDEWNAKWDGFMDAVRALEAWAKSQKDKVDPEAKVALDEAMKDVAAGAAEVGEFMKANMVSGD